MSFSLSVCLCVSVTLFHVPRSTVRSASGSRVCLCLCLRVCLILRPPVPVYYLEAYLILLFGGAPDVVDLKRLQDVPFPLHLTAQNGARVCVE